MTDLSSIQQKYSSLHREYDNQQIDDYETFVRSRVIEYFLNNSQETSVDITSRVNAVLDANKEGIKQPIVANGSVGNTSEKTAPAAATGASSDVASTLRDLAPILIVLTIALVILSRRKSERS